MELERREICLCRPTDVMIVAGASHAGGCSAQRRSGDCVTIWVFARPSLASVAARWNRENEEGFMAQVQLAAARPQSGAVCFFFVTLSCCMAFGTSAQASADKAALRQAQSAFDAGRFTEAVEAADVGLAKKHSDALMFIKSRALYEQAKIEAAWEAIQKVQPGRLPSAMQDVFELEYSKIEAVEKDRLRKAKADAAKPAAPAAGGRGLWPWLVAGGCAVAGGALTFVGLDAMTTANEQAAAGQTTNYDADYSSGNTLHLAGIGLAVVGVGVGAWALLSGGRTGAAPAKQARRWQLLPTILRDGGRSGAALSLSGRF